MMVHFDPKAEELRHLQVGPLGPHVESFAALLSRQGYNRGRRSFSCRGGNARHRTGCTPRRHRLRLGRCVNLVREKAPFPVRFLTRRLTCNE